MPLTVVQAGTKGGRSTLRKKGREFYVRIGKMGQLAMRSKYPNMARTWGKLGGRPKKPSLAEIMEESGRTKKGGAGPPLSTPASPAKRNNISRPR